jgi:hypothetical protein
VADGARPARGWKTCTGSLICGGRLATKASETVVAAEVVCHALNKMSFFRYGSQSGSYCCLFMRHCEGGGGGAGGYNVVHPATGGPPNI